MAIYHMSIKIGSRSKGQSAVAASAYRSGQKLTDKHTGIISDYTRKGGIVHSEIALCANAPAEYADRETLWNAVHEIEKAKNSRLWREFEVALPQELNRADQIETVRDFVNSLVRQGMCVDWSIHDKEDGNPHAHIMTTMRSITEDGSWAAKSRKVYDLDQNGNRIYLGKDKTGRRQYKSHKEDYNDWNAAERVEEWRAEWAKCCNKRLSEHDRIDHRSYARQGKDQMPTIHEGYTARKLTAKGKPSERVGLNEKIRQENAFLAEIKAIEKEIEQLKIEIIKKKGDNINAGKQRLAELFARRNRAVNQYSGGSSNRERAVQNEDTDSLIRQAKTVGASSAADVADSTASRADREAERERLRIEESRRIEENRSRKRKKSKNHGR